MSYDARPEISQLMKDIAMGERTSEELVAFYLRRLLEAQENARSVTMDSNSCGTSR